MSRVRALLTAVVLAALMSATYSLAAEWLTGSKLTMLGGNGSKVVGIGLVEGDRLVLTLVREFRGAGVLMVEWPDGRIEAFDCLVANDGTILVSRAGGVSQLDDEITAGGRTFHVSYGEVGESVARSVPAEPGAVAMPDGTPPQDIVPQPAIPPILPEVMPPVPALPPDVTVGPPAEPVTGPPDGGAGGLVGNVPAPGRPEGPGDGPRAEPPAAPAPGTDAPPGVGDRDIERP